jgi:hypothetical protein
MDRSHNEAKKSSRVPLSAQHIGAPPVRPAPMPRQTLVFWTPRLVLLSAAQVAKGLSLRQRAPQTITQHVTVPVPESDESR